MIPAPFKRYNGGKSGNGVYQTIINLIPPMSFFISPFVGNGGVERRINLPGISMFFDTNKTVVDAWKVALKGYTKKNPGKKIDVINQNGLKAIGAYKGNEKTTFIFCDPPYLFDTRVSQQKLYGEHEWQYNDHVMFLTLLKRCTCNVMVTHPPHILYENMLQGWSVKDYTFIDSSGQKRFDRIWYNYPTPTILQDYTHLGADYRERELVKNKTARHMAKLKRLPDVERNAILSAVINEYGNSSIIKIVNDVSAN